MAPPVCDISFLVPSVSSPVIGPVTVLARILESRYSVEIVGPDFGAGICPMYRDSYEYRAVSTPRLYRFPDYIWERRVLARALSGRIIIAVKARGSSLPVAMLEKRRRSAKVLVYLDEWDGALAAQLSRPERLRRVCRHIHHPLDDIYMPWVERLIHRADDVLSTTTFLQKKFGGHIMHMGVDCDFFRPQPSAQSAGLKASLGLAHRKLIVFGGVVRPHKGVELILESLAKIGDPSLALLIVGPETEHVKALSRNGPWHPYLHCTGSVSKEQMPFYLDLANIIVLPLQNTLLARSQMPCKVFEAMAMAKPIIASNVSDLPVVLEGCGMIVPPDDPSALAEAVEHVLNHPEEAAAMGHAARSKCLNMYSREQTKQNLLNIVYQVA